MAKAKKLPSGSWRAIAYLGRDRQGKKIQKSFTAPTKSEAEELAKICEAVERKAIYIDDRNITVESAVEIYISKKRADMEKGKVSRATIRGYEVIKNNNIDEIKDVLAFKITDRILQNWVDALEDKYSPKTVKNAYSLVHASLMDILPRSTVLDWKIELPERGKKIVNVPSENDIKILLDYFKECDIDMYYACVLASCGTFRRSELCALTADDIEGNTIHVNKALIMDADDSSVWHIQKTKTDMSTRDVELPKAVIDMLPKNGAIINITPSRLSDRFIKAQKKLNIRTFTFHDLRHYSASIMHALGITNEYIMARGGWSNDATLNTHYRGTIDEYTQKYTNLVNNHYEETFLKTM